MRHAAHVVGDEQHELEEGAEPEQEDLRLLADAEPDDRQRHQRRHRQIADEVDDRLERRADDAVAAHQDADRDRHDGGEHEGDPDAQRRDAGVPEQVPASAIMCQSVADDDARRRQEDRVGQAQRARPASQSRARSERRRRRRSRSRRAATSVPRKAKRLAKSRRGARHGAASAGRRRRTRPLRSTALSCRSRRTSVRTGSAMTEGSICCVGVELVVGGAVLEIELHDGIEDAVELAGLPGVPI